MYRSLAFVALVAACSWCVWATSGVAQQAVSTEAPAASKDPAVERARDVSIVYCRPA